WHSPTQAGVVHNIVVVQRSEVGEFDRDGGAVHEIVRARAEFARKQRQHRAYPFAAGLSEVPCWSISDLRGETQVGKQLLLDLGKLDFHALGMTALGRTREDVHRQRLRRGVFGDRTAHTSLGFFAASRGTNPRCSATIPKVRLRYATRSKPASRI